MHSFPLGCALAFLLAGCGDDDPDHDLDGSPASEDCDDNDAGIHPDAIELCDDRDNNCDGRVDEGVLLSFWRDLDGDGFGTKSVVEACGVGAGAATNTLDCDDNDAEVHPGAAEVCNGHDDDCDGVSRNEEPWYRDADGDGFGDVTDVQVACDAPTGFVALGTDCDDTNPAVSPAESEHCDNDYDDDCDGDAAVGVDADGDGYISDACIDGLDCDDADANVHVGAPEVCGDGFDTDCDGHDLFCGYSGDYALGDAGAEATADTNGSDAGRLVDAGDVTGDGLDDIFVATLYANGGKGGGFIVPGPVSGDVLLDDVGFEFASTQATYGASRSIGLGDVDGDGIEDVGFGAPYSMANGQYIVYGPITGDVNLASNHDVALTGRSGIYCGHGSDLGDVNDDGYEDAVIGAYYDNAGGAGSGTLFVEFGPFGGDVDLETDADVEIDGTTTNAFTGRMIHAGKDINGDGIGDFVANSIYDSAGGPQAGGVYVVYGPVTIDSVDDADMLIGPSAQAYAGTAFTVGDYDGDGFADVAVSVGKPAPGGVYVMRGPVGGDVDLAKADIIIEGTGVGQALGSGLGSGDVDADGTDELLIGAPSDNTAGPQTGATFLVFDPPTGTSAIADVAQASFFGESNGDQSGQGVAIGDLDGDGRGEILIGAPALGVGGGVYVEYPDL